VLRRDCVRLIRSSLGSEGNGVGNCETFVV